MIQFTTFRIENDIKINKKNFKTVDLLNNKYMIDKKLRNQLCKDARFRMKI